MYISGNNKVNTLFQIYFLVALCKQTTACRSTASAPPSSGVAPPASSCSTGRCRRPTCSSRSTREGLKMRLPSSPALPWPPQPAALSFRPKSLPLEILRNFERFTDLLPAVSTMFLNKCQLNDSSDRPGRALVARNQFMLNGRCELHLLA